MAEGGRSEGKELGSETLRVSRVGLLPLTSASFFLAMAPAPTPRRCIPALGRGPPRCRTPGLRVPGSAAGSQRGSARAARHLRAPEAARRLPAAGQRGPRLPPVAGREKPREAPRSPAKPALCLRRAPRPRGRPHPRVLARLPPPPPRRRSALAPSRRSRPLATDQALTRPRSFQTERETTHLLLWNLPVGVTRGDSG